MDAVIATARSNKVATTLAMQDINQLRKDYGKEQADVIVNITGNVICGQVMGDTAKMMSERMGKIRQEKESISINRHDTSVSHSAGLDYAVPASKISSLSSGEFVGMVADEPGQKIKLKMFHSEILNNREQLDREAKEFTGILQVSAVSSQQVKENYFEVKIQIKNLLEKEVATLQNRP